MANITKISWTKNASEGRDEAVVNGFTLVRLARREYRFGRIDRFGGLVTCSTLRELLASI